MPTGNQNQIRLMQLNAEAQLIRDDLTLSNTQKVQRLTVIGQKMRDLNGYSDEQVKAQARRLAVGASALSEEDGTFDPDAPRRGKAVPSLKMPTEVTREAYARIKSGSNFRAELGLKDTTSSTATDGQLPPEFGGLVPKIHEPTRILDLLPSSAMSAPSIEFVQHSSTSVASNQIAAPTLALGSASAGGTFGAGSYFWKATYVTPTGETTGSTEVTATLTANQQQALSVGAFPTGVTGWNLYRGNTAGNESVKVNAQPIGTTSYTDTGSAGAAFTVPSVNTTGTAGAVGAGQTMPEAVLNTTQLILTAQKVGIFTTLTDEITADFTSFRDYVNTELTRLIIDQENYQLLYGNGTAPNIRGLLQTAGVLTRAKGSENNLDLVEEAIADLRNGSAYTEPDAILLNPSDWSLIRRTKATGTGNYLLGNPGEVAVDSLWGVPVHTTTQLTQGTGVLLNTSLAGVAFLRQGITLEMTNSSGTDFQSGLVKVRATERLTLGVARPAAVSVISGIA
ncbi:phage major capsid protein [Sinomonas sp. ASV486]|uniref:phage major capsid protein n=1 Tax=Sinomonas sp. ASV486 TaxID=3051170 RepID=UPI0027DCB70D|nr:phage major capsid protein [Sinomonas sp. ASV486]MDQ4490704.1 phage major capsid protein [Sinomonas sp. ASV486]